MRNNKWLIGGLVLSLILNLLLVGFVAGRASGFRPPGWGPDPTAGFFRLLGFLPDDRRAAIAPELRKHKDELWPVLRRMRGEQREVFETLKAEPFDPAALEAALAALRTNLSAAQVASHRAFVEMAKSLTQEERDSLARAMRRPPRPGMDGSERRQHAPFGMHPGGSGDQPPQEGR